jgi:imidazole glycerol-phosphate synthase subunit HisH
MIAIVDFGVGNLRSVQRAVERAGGQPEITSDPLRVKLADAVILPGVGAFGEGMAQLEARGLVDALYQVVAVGKPLLGICLGMQLLFDESSEMGAHPGLGVLRGRAERFPVRPGLHVPHVGWNQLHIKGDDQLLQGVPDGSFAYFVHSYYVAARDADIVTASTNYGLDFASVVAKGNIHGIQFHPEKSQDVGAMIMANFVLLAE